ncbi:MAG: hypothetical protein P8X77_13550 [Maritimibacter sp.]
MALYSQLAPDPLIIFAPPKHRRTRFPFGAVIPTPLRALEMRFDPC